jgi:hypothetical protein
MKPIQILIDNETLAALDSDEEVQRFGRSAVFRRLAAEYVKRKKEKEIAFLYRKAYGGQTEDLNKEFEGWEDEGVWPEQ